MPLDALQSVKKKFHTTCHRKISAALEATGQLRKYTSDGSSITFTSSGKKKAVQEQRAREKFRYDINGLRAWAVAAVVLYHFGIPGFQGGFVGVDVFFVISGFLMSGMIINGLDRSDTANSFSVLSFYLARARRIVPALAALCATLLVVGWFALPAAEYRKVGQHAASALGFVSNIQFWREISYFDPAAHEKWLLHTWSLSAEWQFYLVFPVVLTLLWKKWPGRRAMTGWLLVSFGASLALSIALTPVDPSLAFYLLPTRAWEMLAGGLVFLLAERLTLSSHQRRALELAGFALILGAIVGLESSTRWPGWPALIPVTGAVLVLTAARRESRLTGTRLAQWLGNASYSIYLWHWPVVVALVYLNLRHDTVAVGAGLAATLLLGHASWQWVEQPSRRGLGILNQRRGFAAVVLMITVVAMPGALISLKNGVPGRLSPAIDQVFAAAKDTNPRLAECLVGAPKKASECKYGGNTLGAIVVGDSHGASFVRVVEKAMDQPDHHVLDWTYASCPTLADVHMSGSLYGGHCGDFNSEILKKQHSLGIAPLLIINRTSTYAKGPNDAGRESEFDKPILYFDTQYTTPTPEFLAQFQQKLIDTACQFAQDRPTYLLRPIPELKLNVPRTMGVALLLGHRTRVSISLEEYHSRHRFVWEAQDAARAKCGVRILDPLPYLCSDGRCWGDKDGIPLYYDDDHLSEHGSALLKPLFQTMFQ